MKMRSLALLIFLATLMAPSAHASSRSGSPMNSGFVSSFALTGGIGSAVNKDKSIPKVDLALGEVSIDGGYRFNMVAPIAQATYRYVGQTTDASKVSDLNMAGSGYVLGGGLGLMFQKISLSFVYDAVSQFDLSKASSGGSKVSYDKGTGFHITAKYMWRGNWEVVAAFSDVKYEKKKSGTTSLDISDNPVTYSLYGVGFGYRF